MKRVIIALLLLLMSFTLMPQKDYAATNSDKKVVLVIIDRVSLNDYIKYDAKNIKKLINNGTVGLMNVRNADGYVDASGYLTFGTGTRASAYGISSINLNVNENYTFGSAGDLYKLNTGNDYGNNNIVNIGISNLISSSESADYKITPGLLGQLLKDNNIPTYVFGNSDITSDNSITYRRYGALIAMDEKGTAFGDVSENILKYDKNSPYFMRTDYNKILDYFKEYEKNGGFFVIDTGDTSRVDSYSSNVSSEIASKFKKYAIINADNFIGKLLENIDASKDLLIVATPYPSKSDISSSNLLAPIIIYGPGYNGLTTSLTTKRDGIIANIDLAPTILNYFNIKAPVEMLGHPITNVKTQNKVNYLENLNNKVVSIYTARPIVLKSYVIFLIIILILYLITLFLKIGYLKYLKPVVLGVMIVPLSLLILSLFSPLSIYSSIIVLILITTLLLLLIKLIAKDEFNMLIVR